MSVETKRWAATGAAVLTAGALAITPMTVTPSAPTGPAPLVTGVSLVAGVSPIDSATAIVGGFAQSGVRFVQAVAASPVRLINIGQGALTGTPGTVSSNINEFVTGPLWVLDKTLEGLNAGLPAPLGGGAFTSWNAGPHNSQIQSFRTDVLYPLMNKEPSALVTAGVATLFGAGNDFLQSGIRTAQGIVTSPLGLVKIGQAAIAGDKQGVYNAIRDYIDAPLWAIDPALAGLNLLLPAPLGGGDPTQTWNSGPTDSAIFALRANVLWKATDTVRTGVANAIGADPNGAPTNTAPVTPHSQLVNTNSTTEDITGTSGLVDFTTSGSNTGNQRDQHQTDQSQTGQQKTGQQQTDNTETKQGGKGLLGFIRDMTTPKSRDTAPSNDSGNTESDNKDGGVSLGGK